MIKFIRYLSFFISLILLFIPTLFLFIAVEHMVSLGTLKGSFNPIVATPIFFGCLIFSYVLFRFSKIELVNYTTILFLIPIQIPLSDAISFSIFHNLNERMSGVIVISMTVVVIWYLKIKRKSPKQGDDTTNTH